MMVSMLFWLIWTRRVGSGVSTADCLTNCAEASHPLELFSRDMMESVFVDLRQHMHRVRNKELETSPCQNATAIRRAGAVPLQRLIMVIYWSKRSAGRLYSKQMCGNATQSSTSCILLIPNICEPLNLYMMVIGGV